ncbi:thiosulfate sulfurtransferase [Moniliophthora roreri]|nr:thiosulfate sulfurtransferase [Moniliophthora roreri]
MKGWTGLALKDNLCILQISSVILTGEFLVTLVFDLKSETEREIVLLNQWKFIIWFLDTCTGWTEALSTVLNGRLGLAIEGSSFPLNFLLPSIFRSGKRDP